MGRIRRQLQTIEGARSSQLHITAWNHLQGLKVQYSKYQKVKRDIIQVVKLAEDTLLESDPRAFLKKSEAFKAQAGELLKILGLDLKPCVPKDFDYSSAAKKREVRRGLGFGASSNRFSVDGSLMRLNEGRGGKSG